MPRNPRSVSLRVRLHGHGFLVLLAANTRLCLGHDVTSLLARPLIEGVDARYIVLAYEPVWRAGQVFYTVDDTTIGYSFKTIT